MKRIFIALTAIAALSSCSTTDEANLKPSKMAEFRVRVVKQNTITIKMLHKRHQPGDTVLIEYYNNVVKAVVDTAQ